MIELKYDCKTPEEAVEHLYLFIKANYRAGNLKAKHLESLSELVTELAAIAKIEEESGKQED
jgi:hypothetical protein